MSRIRKKITVVIVGVVLLTAMVSASAFIPAAAVAGWLLDVTAGSVLVSDLVAGMSGTIAGVLWYDCNKFSASTVCSNKPANMPAAQAPGAYITVELNPDSKRTNPDPSSFNDPSGNARDVTPKASMAAKPDGGSVASYGSNFVQTGDKATYQAPSGHYFQMGGSGEFKGVDSTSVIMAAYKTNWPICATVGVQCVIKGPYGWDGNCSHYDIRDVANGVDNYIASPGVCAWNSGMPPCPNGAATDGSGTCNTYLQQTPTVGCPSGYALSGSTCNLTDASQVKKPSATPCEVIYDGGAGQLQTDPANPNCASVQNGSAISVESNDGSNSSLTVAKNNNGGFDITQTKGSGSSVTASTGPYDPTSGGYHIIYTSSKTPSGQTPDGEGDGCGIPGKPACDVQFSTDAAMSAAEASSRDAIKSGYSSLKGVFDSIDPSKFEWSFIPQIPTSQCVNPRVKNPLITQYLDVDICKWFNKFSSFLNGVLAVLCLYGCVRQVGQAMRA